MSRRYFRQGSGRFRGATLVDFGMACCETCGAIFTPIVKEQDGFIDPRDYREASRFCADCGGNPESKSTGLVADGNDIDGGQER